MYIWIHQVYQECIKIVQEYPHFIHESTHCGPSVMNYCSNGTSIDDRKPSKCTLLLSSVHT